MSEVPTTAAIAAGVESEDERLQDAARLRSLAQSGLGAQLDPKMQAVAERVHRWLGVPIALVSLVGRDRQVFPGMTGLPEPWATSRSAPLGHSHCRHVVTATEPLIVSDAREHPLLRDSPAVDELGAVAYAGMPLTDEAGNVLGALCAIDVAPRQWTADELDLLRGLAEACSTELRLRLSRFSARDERRRRDELEQRLRGSFDRSQALLAASEAFSDTVTVEDVRIRVSELVKTELRPSYVGLALLGDDGRLHRMRDTRLPRGLEDTGPWLTYDLLTAVPTATAVRQRRIVAYDDRPGFDADHPESARRLLRDLDLHAIVAVPLMHRRTAAGCTRPRLGRPAPSRAGRAAHPHHAGRVHRAGTRPGPAAAPPRQRRPSAAAGHAHHPAGRVRAHDVRPLPARGLPRGRRRRLVRRRARAGPGPPRRPPPRRLGRRRHRSRPRCGDRDGAGPLDAAPGRVGPPGRACPRTRCAPSNSPPRASG